MTTPTKTSLNGACAFLFLAATLSAQSLMPLDVGNRWVYVLGNGAEATTEIVGKRTAGGVEGAVARSVTPFGTSDELLVWNGGDLRYLHGAGEDGAPFWGYRIVGPATEPHQVRQTTPEGFEVFIDQKPSVPIVVPAGSATGVQVEFKIDAGQGVVRGMNVFVPGVGLVRQEFEFPNGQRLVSALKSFRVAPVAAVSAPVPAAAQPFPAPAPLSVPAPVFAPHQTPAPLPALSPSAGAPSFPAPMPLRSPAAPAGPSVAPVGGALGSPVSAPAPAPAASDSVLMSAPAPAPAPAVTALFPLVPGTRWTFKSADGRAMTMTVGPESEVQGRKVHEVVREGGRQGAVADLMAWEADGLKVYGVKDARGTNLHPVPLTWIRLPLADASWTTETPPFGEGRFAQESVTLPVEGGTRSAFRLTWSGTTPEGAVSQEFLLVPGEGPVRITYGFRGQKLVFERVR